MTKSTPDLRALALGCLTRREYAREELRRRLSGLGGEEEIAVLLDEFQQRGWLSDQRYADQMVHARKGKYGSLKLAHELRAQGVAEELVDKAVAELQGSEQETARKLWRKKFAAVPQNREEWAKQARFLQGRGFSMDTIKAVLRGEPEDE